MSTAQAFRSRPYRNFLRPSIKSLYRRLMITCNGEKMDKYECIGHPKTRSHPG